ncbi:dUTP diphosphatase [Clostridium saccharobutylicum]|uniref:Deoxyuridine 5'-triphosphate nucleotidohydrolase n=1 Tax=Clostridium saccharobutylicum DSM 13864 TaxID=1345695 RepID=U5MZP3_CLOSA|nr:dUTP diphosphatase [Clostridium saccharobutylicum]AGX44972.1 deoxyuridine 5'-triphosphate nucleotidohydrolase Dut [Clostridium saccharobutylicum DSM 13864]AQR92254.1 deoxyuridine 5'-triphosphate nucleotidohydrolase [Clostridium saccharobutylicum]AQS02156.1 deoxyuridine 5'-triphosphate nucleotidohydrolase [Clostridium saccharobutylicum]AQS11760.1 deoxyuridine 5'-triphosphate nucleotidohydrolase [Clostridium saccharobutylicum]AQS16139.1 deoxyuridine 5'-triphosphate nucleotidohydrolase [Clostr
MEEYILKIRKINDKAILPNYAHEGDAGLDLYAVEGLVLNPGERGLVHTGIQIELPRNTEAQIRPRSGLALKNGITTLNSPGTIDEGYRGEIGVILINHSQEVFKVDQGMKIAQMVIKPVFKVNVVEETELSNSERSERGFGSSGIR